MENLKKYGKVLAEGALYGAFGLFGAWGFAEWRGGVNPETPWLIAGAGVFYGAWTKARQLKILY